MGWFDWFDWLVALVAPFTEPVQEAAVFIFIVGILFNLSSIGLNKLFIDFEEQREYNRVQAEVRRLEKEVRITGDKKLKAKLRKREAAKKALGWKTGKRSLMMTVVSMVLFGFIFTLLNSAFIKTNSIDAAALLPISIPSFSGHTPIPFFFWYLICAFAIGRPMYKILGVPTGMGMGVVPTEEKKTEARA